MSPDEYAASQEGGCTLPAHPHPHSLQGSKSTGYTVYQGQGRLCHWKQGADTLAFSLFLCDLWDATTIPHLVIYFKR